MFLFISLLKVHALVKIIKFRETLWCGLKKQNVFVRVSEAPSSWLQLQMRGCSSGSIVVMLQRKVLTGEWNQDRTREVTASISIYFSKLDQNP